jgi:hypothetical protein
MGAYRVAPYAVHIDRGGGRSADRDSKPDVRASDIRDQPEYPGRIEILDISDFVSSHIFAGTFRASGRFVHCHRHHLTPKRGKDSLLRTALSTDLRADSIG